MLHLFFKQLNGLLLPFTMHASSVGRYRHSRLFWFNRFCSMVVYHCGHYIFKLVPCVLYVEIYQGVVTLRL